ncbi:MAG TPA: 2-succinyl-5-enolpyruvyl-6-hydroxy-3-cyclohexene-1-carboxylic-acid synthase [Kofleriaceae bacterium]|nr:2-succinyl-5-enolpyruvyl-6-hydroxy-3-cyclohexene-1-carboxylic-acid synthase [Kofleriaceae bacterium]
MNLPWAELLLASLREAGCGELVVSPGSRSTPLVMAAARLGIGCHVLVDERTAGFFALGRARASGAPSGLVCTSGTAGAHYLPAIIEASLARVPLVVLTADRPPELHGCAAPQTIDQQHLYGRFTRGFADLGVPEAADSALVGVRRRAAQMVALARGPEPGPVHINVPARKPLEPTGSGEEARVAARVAELCARPIARAAPAAARVGDDVIEEIGRALGRARRALLVAGPAPLDQPAGPLAELARASGLPLLAEVTSQLRFTGEEPAPGLCDRFDLLLRAPGWSAAHRPDLIVEFGAPPTSSAYAALVAAAGCQRIVVAPQGWSDPHGTAQLLVQAPVAEVAGRLAAQVTARPGGWTEAWVAASRRAGAALDRLAVAGGEHAAVRAAIGALPDGALLMLGNSLPVRTAEACAADRRRIGVLHQRGAAGIDGLIAGAAGAASAARRPTAVLLGDVSFAHDLGGLAAARLAGAPLAVVVIDNGGGRIFEQLPVARAAGGAELLERFFLTPPAVDVAAAAAAFGLRCVRTERPGEAVAAALAGAGATVIHLPVAPHSARDLEAAVAAEVDA